ncbi:ATPase family associated with various cellular activities (AAA) [Flavobacterium anhuiense]|uniref:ATPase family associated with various cellular activities (AAA) n=1 Tax=Flavobacterium anhuiense TaxID=459526 RepID=A0ABY0LXF0_9FLAO|nr:ATP-binding protein [Flavobacterium anhuiense]SCY76098.1 ATPase family associated with various cellular activities (AAA) [Flavobacterium anhuiense]
MNSTIHDYIIRISTPEGFGGGFIFSPSSDSSEAYIITARHCLTDKSDIPLKKDNIVIQFLLDGEWQSYDLNDTDVILLGENFDTEDIGIIIVPLSILPSCIDLEHAPKLCEHPRDSICAEITGIPKAVQNKRKRTLYRLNVVGDRDYDNEIQIEVADPITGHYNSDNLVEGYSGSPIVLKTEIADYVCGIFRSYEITTKRVLGINLHLVNTLLENYRYEILPLLSIETNQDILNAIKQLNSNTERVLSRIRDKVGVINLERSKLTSALIKKINDSKFTIVYGNPGVGKSSIVKRAFHELGESHSIIALQGEQLDKNSLIEIFRQNPFGFVPELEYVLSSNYFTKHKILLIDSIEKLLETKNADTILDFFALIAKRDDIKIVMTCRSYAIESLKIRFLRQFPIFSDFKIPVLSDDELLKVEREYPQLKSLLEKESLAKVLEIPFNLDLAVNLASGTVMEDVDSEMAFRKIMWDYVIESRISHCEASVKRLRGEVFMLIAITRTAGMSTYAFIDTPHDTIIEALYHDGIIDKEPTTGRGYAASHDIFEDWALERHIEENFQRYAIAEGRYDHFYIALDTTAAIRRAFRIWFSEKMQIGSPQANELMKLTLSEKEVENYWKDEILVAIMQSPYSKIFLEENKVFLFQDNFKYFTRSIFVLKVACQKLDLTNLNLYKPEEKTKFYHNVNLIPFGDGWQNMISFVNDNISSLERQFPKIINMILEWKKGIKDSSLPPEAREVAMIILAYFKSFETEDKDSEYLSSLDSYLEDCIRLLLRLSEVVSEEVRELIYKAHTTKISNRKNGLKRVYGSIIKFVISGDESKIVSMNYPELVIEILEEKWFYYPPPPAEEIKNDHENQFIYKGHYENKENSFGISAEIDLRYFPASPYQTPISYLLLKKPVHTINFIVKLLNHCTLAYLQSDYDKKSTYQIESSDRTKFELQFTDGSVNTQHASATLWTMFRGTYIAVPDLIESVLMALEQFLLSLAGIREETIETEEDKSFLLIWDYAFETLLKKSNNVMGSAVLMSVAMAHPKLGATKVLPLLGFKDIYNWDILRVVKESSAFSPLGTMRNAREHQIKLHNFQKLEHRKIMIRDFVRDHSTGKLAPQIHKILDALYEDPKADEQWKLQVSYMDYRKYQVTAKVPEGYLVEAIVDESLQHIVDEYKKDAEESSVVSIATNWSFKKFQYTPVEDESYKKWQDVFKVIKDAEQNTKINVIEKNTGLTAGIGVRDYFVNLNEIERNWCTDKICAIIEYDLHRADEKIGFFGFTHTPLETEISYSVLPLLMHLSEGELKSKLKRYIFLALISYRGNLEKKPLFKTIHNYLWKNDPNFMENCIAGIYHYSSFSKLLYRTRHLQISSVALQKRGLVLFIDKLIKYFKGSGKISEINAGDEKLSRDQKIIEVRRKYDELIKSIEISDNEILLESIEFDDNNIDILLEIHKLIPYDTESLKLQGFCLSLLKYILNNLNKKDYRVTHDQFNYQSLHEFGEFSAKYMLNQKLEVASNFFETMTDIVFESSDERKMRNKVKDFISQRLEDLHLAYLADESKLRYWNLLEKFIDKCTKAKVFTFDKQLLFNHYYMSDSYQFNWLPLAGKKQLLLDFIDAGANLDNSIKLVSGIGFTEMMPDAVEVIASRMSKDRIDYENSYYFDKLIIQAYHDSTYRKALQSNVKLRNSFIKILDLLINKNASSSAYIIREDFIFSKSLH